LSLKGPPRVRSLSPDEALLWGKVAATIRPLSRERAAFETILQVPPAAPERPRFRPPSQPVDRPAQVAIGDKTLDGSWDKKLRGGDVEPDRIVDLHGMNLDRAWSAIDISLEQALARGDRVVLLITGHHRPGEPPVQRGRIRAAVHDWLAASRHASSIAAVRGAHRRHGGGGSLYLVLRRKSFRR
jgi:DNA-nicking Smr family endonuclease